jgi:hypothetical protein
VSDIPRQKNALIQFLRKYLLGSSPGHEPPTVKIKSTEIALSASTSSTTDNTVKAVGKWPIQAKQTVADGYGLFVNRSGSVGDNETFALALLKDWNGANDQPVLQIDQRATTSEGGTGHIINLRGVPPWQGYLGISTWYQEHLVVTPEGRLGLSQGTANTPVEPTYKIDMQVNSYWNSAPSFNGSGLDDMVQLMWPSGWTTADASTSYTYRIQIDGTGTPDTFKWGPAGAGWLVETVDITGGWQELENGIYIAFPATTGHTSADYWDISPRIVPPMRIKNAAGTTIFSIENDGDLTVTNIEQPAWTAVTFATDWEDYSTSTYEECSYFKDSMGFVHLRGLAECSDPFGGGDTIFTLPTGYRPSRQGIYNVRSNDAAGVDTCRVNVNADGTVEATDDFTPVAGAWVSLSGILFDTRAST